MDDKLKFLKLLSESFPTIGATTTEIINLKAILNLPPNKVYLFFVLYH